MRYVGMLTQIRRNNIKTVLLLLMFPVIIFLTVWVFLALVNYLNNGYYDQFGNYVHLLDLETVNYYFVQSIPWVFGGVGIWFVLAYFNNTSMIRRAVNARPLQRSENPRVYNIVENLCMTCNMDMPKINIVDDPQLNAFASGIDKSTYTVTLTSGIINYLNDDELAGVIGHELTHIRNHDTRLLITSIIFVGIISTIMGMIVRTLYYSVFFGGNSRSYEDSLHSSDNERRDRSGGGWILVMVIGLVCVAIAYIFTLLTRFAISRKREYMADAGGAELCGNPLALASALRKISNHPGLGNVNRDDIAQLYIIHPHAIHKGIMSLMGSLFSTHPDTKKRIEILEQF